jgi:hypothetical protein
MLMCRQWLITITVVARRSVAACVAFSKLPLMDVESINAALNDVERSETALNELQEQLKSEDDVDEKAVQARDVARSSLVDAATKLLALIDSANVDQLHQQMKTLVAVIYNTGDDGSTDNASNSDGVVGIDDDNNDDNNGEDNDDDDDGSNNNNIIKNETNEPVDKVDAHEENIDVLWQAIHDNIAPLQQWNDAMIQLAANRASRIKQQLAHAAEQIDLFCATTNSGNTKKASLARYQQLICEAKSLADAAVDQASVGAPPLPQQQLTTTVDNVARLCASISAVVERVRLVGDRQRAWLTRWNDAKQSDVVQLETELRALRKRLKRSKKALLTAQHALLMAQTDTDSDDDDDDGDANGVAACTKQVSMAKKEFGTASRAVDQAALRLYLLATVHFPVCNQCVGRMSKSNTD